MIVHFFCDYEPADAETRRRHAIARETWGRIPWVERAVRDVELCRYWPENGHSFPVLTDVFDLVASEYGEDDILVYTNTDVLVRSDVVRKIEEKLATLKDACYGPRRNFASINEPLRDEVFEMGELDGGIDLVAFRNRWWLRHARAFDGLLLGVRYWDSTFATLVDREYGKGTGMLANVVAHEYHKPRVETSHLTIPEADGHNGKTSKHALKVRKRNKLHLRTKLVYVPPVRLGAKLELHTCWLLDPWRSSRDKYLKSWMDKGFDVVLWHGGQLESSPEGVELRLARELVEGSVIERAFAYESSVGSHASAADLFRYEVLHRFGGGYVDLDMQPLPSVSPAVLEVATPIFELDEQGKLEIRFIASPPRHPLIRTLRNEAVRRSEAFREHGYRSSTDVLDIMKRTGPKMARAVVKRWAVASNVPYESMLVPGLVDGKTDENRNEHFTAKWPVIRATIARRSASRRSR